MIEFVDLSCERRGCTPVGIAMTDLQGTQHEVVTEDHVETDKVDILSERETTILLEL